MLPTGSIDTRSDRVFVRVSGQFASEEDLRNVPIAADGRVIRLGDFATVTRGFEDPPSYTVRHNGQQAELPYGVELERVADQPTTVSEAIWEFERSLLEALAIVLAVSLLRVASAWCRPAKRRRSPELPQHVPRRLSCRPRSATASVPR